MSFADLSSAFDTRRYALGPICLQGHAWGASGQSLRFRVSGCCVQCEQQAAKQRAGIASTGAPTTHVPDLLSKYGLRYVPSSFVPATDDERLLRTLAKQKSYIGASIATFLLYFLWFLPGLMANSHYLQEAIRMEEVAGEPLPGVGLLRDMMLFALALCAGAVLLAAVVLLAIPFAAGR